MHLADIISSFGPLGIWLSILAESGLGVFFMPGDSLLITSGFLASVGVFNLSVLALGSFVSSLLGTSLSFMVGDKFEKLLKHPKYFRAANQFYKKYGHQALMFYRFIPIIRSFVPFVAGTTNMSAKTFFVYNTIGCAVWGLGLPLVGYTLGQLVPQGQEHLIPITIGVIILSLVPSVLHYWKRRIK